MLQDNNETHPLISDYLQRNDDNNNLIDDELQSYKSETSSITALIQWTTCDEIKRCSLAVLSFILMATLIGAALVVFWFLWAWFVLWLNLPGVATPIVWLCGFLAPLCLFRLFSFCPRCTRGCCAKPLKPAEINSWKSHHLWNERRQHINAILKAAPSLPSHLGEIISDYCYHSDILVTTRDRKLIGIYPDSGQTHTIAEFSQNLTDLVVKGGNIHNVFVLLRREMEPVATHIRNEVGCEVNENTPLISSQPNNNNNNGNNNNNNDNNNGKWWKKVPGWLWDPTEYTDMIICEYDLAQGILKQQTGQFQFSQVSNTTMQQLKGIYYKAHYRLLNDTYRDKLIVSRDGEFLIFNEYLKLEKRRELIAKPENGNDRDQFLHISEYKWQSMIIIPPEVVKRILNIVDIVERSDSSHLINDDEIYVMIPFSDHALFVGNINSGWLRYLDFSHVNPISTSEIHQIEFSQDNQYMYVTMTQNLTLMNTNNFQSLLTIRFNHLDYTIPCGIVRLPPEELQLNRMKQYYYNKALQNYKNNTRYRRSSSVDLEIESIDDTEIKSQHKLDVAYNYEELRKKLESICIFFTSTKIYSDPRAFIYRFPKNKSKVLTIRRHNSRPKWFDGTFLLNRYDLIKNTTSTTTLNKNDDNTCGGWHYLSLKNHKPWNNRNNKSNNFLIQSFNTFDKIGFDTITHSSLNRIEEESFVDDDDNDNNDNNNNNNSNSNSDEETDYHKLLKKSSVLETNKPILSTSNYTLNPPSSHSKLLEFHTDSDVSDASDDIPSVISNEDQIILHKDKDQNSTNNENQEYVVPIV